MRTFRATYTRPTRAALKGTLGDAPVRLRVSRELRDTLMARLAKTPSPAEAVVRTWYGAHVEPVVRWLPDLFMRGVWAVQRACRPVTSKLRRPRPRGPRIRLIAGVPYLTAEQRAYVSAVLKAKMPAIAPNDLVETWNQVGKKVAMTWTLRRRPPKHVGYGDLAARLGGLKESEWFFGLGVGAEPVVVSLDDDSPHVGVSAASGAGKSVLAKLVAVQVLCRGGRVIILDLKGSHRWAIGMPGVDYCLRPEQMHDALLKWAAVAEERNLLAFHEEEGWDPGPRVLVICEELNATTSRLRAYWDSVRTKPGRSPAVEALEYLLCTGRAAKVNVAAFAQMLTARSVGGPEGRENFAIRCLCRWSTNAWKMLAGDVSMPRPSRIRGRWQVVIAGVATETQVCYLTDDQARLLVHKMSPTSPRPRDISAFEPVKGDPRVSGDAGTPADQVTLRQAVDMRIVSWNYEAMKKRLQRARKADAVLVPVPVGRDGNADLYERTDLVAWIESEMVT